MLQPTPVPRAPFLARLRTGGGRRMLALGLALLIEAILLLMLLTLGVEKRAGTEEKRITLVDLDPNSAPLPTPEQSSPEPEQPPDLRPPPPSPPTAEPATDPPRAEPALPAEPAPAPVPTPAIRLPTNDAPAGTPRPGPPGRTAYGPPDRGRPAHLRDAERVGTAPNGDALYAASWYREPSRESLGAYLSGARGPGWGLIACRTVVDYRVEDCVGIAEYPEGSQIMRAVLAAAWEFRVRPPRLGGKPMVGSWVRIRIDYGKERR